MKVTLSRATMLGMVLALAGCGQGFDQAMQSAATDSTKQNLQTMGQIFHLHHDTHQQFPENWDALLTFAKDSGDGAEAIQQLRDSGCVVNGWGLRMRDITIGSSNYALAYLPEATTNGGLVLHADGAVFHMSADELKQALEKHNEM